MNPHGVSPMAPEAVTPAERDRLTLIRQFILAPRTLEEFPGWHHHAVGQGFHLYTNPELPVHEAGEGQTWHAPSPRGLIHGSCWQHSAGRRSRSGST